MRWTIMLVQAPARPLGKEVVVSGKMELAVLGWQRHHRRYTSST